MRVRRSSQQGSRVELRSRPRRDFSLGIVMEIKSSSRVAHCSSVPLLLNQVGGLESSETFLIS